jgi:hypothetical protein
LHPALQHSHAGQQEQERPTRIPRHHR